jgi:hypothetical protein
MSLFDAARFESFTLSVPSDALSSDVQIAGIHGRNSDASKLPRIFRFPGAETQRQMLPPSSVCTATPRTPTCGTSSPRVCSSASMSSART